MTGIPSPNLSWLPGIEYWGARRIETAVDASAAGGGLIGYMLGALLSTPIAVVAGVARHRFGYPYGHAAQLFLTLCSVYVALLALAHWQQIDEEV